MLILSKQLKEIYIPIRKNNNNNNSKPNMWLSAHLELKRLIIINITSNVQKVTTKKNYFSITIAKSVYRLL